MRDIKKWESLFVNGKISRRSFITGMAAFGAAAAASPVLTLKTAHASTPKKGGRFRIGCKGGATMDSLDPVTILDMMPLFINYQLRNNLVEVDHNGVPQPELAESWEAAPGAATWVFKLRKGVEFHNGKTLTAEDVIFSINHNRGKDSKSPAKAMLAGIKEIKADGKDTLVFKLEAGIADFPFYLSDYHLTVCPAGTMDFEKGIGTGGYTLVNHEPGVKCLVKRNPNYWKEGRAHFDEVETIHIGDMNARTAALMTGSVDAINKCDVKTFDMLMKKPDIKTIEKAGHKHFNWAMWCDQAPFDSKDVRMALKYAIDREHMLKTILRGHGALGNDHPISPVMRYHNKDLEQRAYDPDKARYHIKKAGLEGAKFDLYTAESVFPGAVDAAVLYKEHAAKAGININVVRAANDGYWSDVWLKKPFCTVYWGGRPTEDLMFTSSSAKTSSWNDTHFNHERFNKLLLEARAELDEEKRREMYYAMQEIVRDDGGVTIFAFVSNLDAVRDNVKFGTLASNWEFDGAKCSERWWFDS